jgi:hypothetical protein
MQRVLIISVLWAVLAGCNLNNRGGDGCFAPTHCPCRSMGSQQCQGGPPASDPNGMPAPWQSSEEYAQGFQAGRVGEVGSSPWAPLPEGTSRAPLPEEVSPAAPQRFLMPHGYESLQRWWAGYREGVAMAKSHPPAAEVIATPQGTPQELPSTTPMESALLERPAAQDSAVQAAPLRMGAEADDVSVGPRSPDCENVTPVAVVTIVDDGQAPAAETQP